MVTGVFVGVFHVIGFGTLGIGLSSARRPARAARWPIARGKMIKVELDADADLESTTDLAVHVEVAGVRVRLRRDALAEGRGWLRSGGRSTRGRMSAI